MRGKMSGSDWGKREFLISFQTGNCVPKSHEKRVTLCSHRRHVKCVNCMQSTRYEHIAEYSHYSWWLRWEGLHAMFGACVCALGACMHAYIHDGIRCMSVCMFDRKADVIQDALAGWVIWMCAVEWAESQKCRRETECVNPHRRFILFIMISLYVHAAFHINIHKNTRQLVCTHVKKESKKGDGWKCGDRGKRIGRQRKEKGESEGCSETRDSPEHSDRLIVHNL